MAPHPDLPAEQAHITKAYARLVAMRESARAVLQEALRTHGSTFQAVTERDIVVRNALHRLDQLDIGRESLTFGRIDELDGEAFHIGRLAISGEDQDPLVVDWRAPIAEPFYRATGREPMGLARRRHFATDGPILLGIEDEVFAAGDGDGDELGLVGTGALLAALDRSRSGQMRDIVATVQREQDEIIRAPLAGVLVVQGGPGTGKTAVALHRAAYLLYTFRFPLERQGVLVVGPNPVFLRYIGQVLPSLGETGVHLSTVGGLVAGTSARGTETLVAARVKADVRMARVLARAVGDRQRPLHHDVAVGFGATTLRLTAAASAQIVATVKRRPGPHNSRRRQVEAMVARRLHDQHVADLERRERLGLLAAVPHTDEIGGDDDDVVVGTGPLDERELWASVRREPALVEALHRMWPVLTPVELLHDLFGARPLLALAGRGTLSRDEVDALVRPRAAGPDSVLWTAADLPLLDEARVLLGHRKPRPEHELRAYGHIVVDAAQDLTPMQLRMLARRSISGSMTVVGDIAQATGVQAPASWDDITRHLPGGRPTRTVELSVNYRTPTEIMELAGRVLAVAAPSLRPPRSVRSVGTGPVFRSVAADRLARVVAEIGGTEATAIGSGSVAVLCPPSLRRAVADGLAAGGVPFADAEAEGLDAAISLVPVAIAKGLEFDSVVVVEPARVVAEAPLGLRTLYVALTRATRRLTIVHAEPLPAPLVSADDGS